MNNKTQNLSKNENISSKSLSGDNMDYSSMRESDIFDIIKIEIQGFISQYEYVPSSQIYATLPLPSLKFLKEKYGLSYSDLLKKIGCDNINGIKIHKHVPKDVLIRRFKLKIDNYLKNTGRLPNKKAFNEFKIGSINFYEGRFNMSYHELLEIRGYSLKLKHKPRVYSNYTHEQIFEMTKEEIKGFLEKNDVLPTQFQYSKFNAPSEIYFKKRHGLTYNALLLKLGFVPSNTGERYNYLSDEECLEKIDGEIKSFAKIQRRVPTSKDIHALNVPSLGYIKKRFGYTYKELIKSLGYKDYEFIEGYIGLDDCDVFNKISAEINKYISENGKLPTQKQYDLLCVPSTYTMKKLYNMSYNQMIEKLGFSANRK